MVSEVKRAVRVAEGIREVLAELFTTEVRDPRLAGVVICRAELTDDLRLARIYYRFLDGDTDAAREKAASDGFYRASGLLRRELTHRLGLRYAPELRFFFDKGQERLRRIEEILREVHDEERRRSTEHP